MRCGAQTAVGPLAGPGCARGAMPGTVWAHEGARGGERLSPVAACEKSSNCTRGQGHLGDGCSLGRSRSRMGEVKMEAMDSAVVALVESPFTVMKTHGSDYP